MGTYYQKALKYLADGDVKSAVNLHNEIADAIQALEDDRAFIDEMIVRYKENAPAPEKDERPAKEKSVQVIPPRLRRLTQVDRSILIKKCAAGLAEKNGGKVNISAVEDEIKAVGYDINTKVPGTVIANVLMKTQGWKRVGTGVFQREQQQ